jgi:hypothetical protein
MMSKGNETQSSKPIRCMATRSRRRMQRPALIGYGGATMSDRGDGTRDERTGLLALTLLALALGALAGALGAAFRLALEAGDGWRNAILAWAQGYAWLGLPLVAGTTAACTALAAFLVRRFARYASGSGTSLGRLS